MKKLLFLICCFLLANLNIFAQTGKVTVLPRGEGKYRRVEGLENIPIISKDVSSPLKTIKGDSTGFQIPKEDKFTPAESVENIFFDSFESESKPNTSKFIIVPSNEIDTNQLSPEFRALLKSSTFQPNLDVPQNLKSTNTSIQLETSKQVSTVAPAENMMQAQAAMVTDNSRSVGNTNGSFSVSLTGAATYTIPIDVPPGVQGIVPNVSLVYSSQNGLGIAGMCLELP